MPSVRDLSPLHDLDLILGQHIKLSIHFASLPDSGSIFFDRCFNPLMIRKMLDEIEDGLRSWHGFSKVKLKLFYIEIGNAHHNLGTRR
jgi:hypothetical protein